MARVRKQMLIAPNLYDVDASGGGFHIPEGEYEMQVKNVELVESKSSDNEMWKFTFLGKSGKSKGKQFFLNCVLTDNALWKLRQTLEALGVEIPDSEIEMDPDDLIGIDCTGVVVDRDYEGRTYSNLDRVLGGEEGEPEEEEEASKSSKRPVGRPRKEAANGKTTTKKQKVVKLEADEIKEMDEDELESLVEKYDLDIDLSKFATLRRKSAAVLTSLEAGGMLEE